jgi:hypothetical protein
MARCGVVDIGLDHYWLYGGANPMKSVCCSLIIILGLAWCVGCGDNSTQSWEDSKSSSSKEKSGKSADVANNDTANNDSTADQPDNSRDAANPHSLVNPHGANPHAGMQMTGESGSGPMENDGKLDLGPLHWTVPKTWVRKAPGMMVQAEYAVPKAEGDKENGRLTVSLAGGSVEGNIDRWKGQFNPLDKQNQETIDVNKVKVTIVDFSGSYAGMPNSGGSHADYRMIAAIAEVPGDRGMCFMKCYGPAKTVAAHADEIKEFIRSLKVDKQ